MCLPMASKPPSLSPAYGALVAMMVFWGLSFVATKVALETFPTFTLIFCRFDPHFAWSLGTSFMGDLLIFGAVISAALYTVSARAAGRKSSVLDVTGHRGVDCFGGKADAPPDGRGGLVLFGLFLTNRLKT